MLPAQYTLGAACHDSERACILFPHVDQARREAAGTLFSFLAFLIWGLLPLYWKLVDVAPAAEILSHRVLWSCLLMVPVAFFSQRRELRRAIADPWALAAAAAAGVLVGGNWFLYMWAVVADRVVDASLGYYITPFVNVLLGITVLRERLTKAQAAALAIAGAGVLLLAVSLGHVPWISLGLASSFGIYGLVKKTGRLGAVVSLLVELVVLAPAATVYLVVQARAGLSAFGHGDPLVMLLLVGAGVVTVIPLLLFGAGARRIPLSRVGFLQYVAPTLMLLIGTVIYREPFTVAHVASFACIWSALLIYGLTLRRRDRAKTEL